MKSLNFQLQDSCCDAKGVATCQLNKNWYVFMKKFYGLRVYSDDFDGKRYVMFQIAKHLFHSGSKKTPLHVSIHKDCKSKKLIAILNRLG